MKRTFDSPEPIRSWNTPRWARCQVHPYAARAALSLILLLGVVHSLFAQAVTVTARLDTNRIGTCETTTLRVYAQVIPTLQAGSDRIFSWHVDVLHSHGATAFANFDALTRPASDNDPLISSNGFTAGPGTERRGIFDTFLNRPGAGVSAPVELVAIPITGLTPGTTRFSVRRGTGTPNLAEDFIVAPLTGGDPGLGGDYSVAFVDLTVGRPTRI